MSRYPTTIPTDDIRNLYNIAKAGEIKDRVAEFAEGEWWIQGYLQSKLFGAPANFGAHDASEGVTSDATTKDLIFTAEEQAELAKLEFLAGVDPADFCPEGVSPAEFSESTFGAEPGAPNWSAILEKARKAFEQAQNIYKILLSLGILA